MDTVTLMLFAYLLVMVGSSFVGFFVGVLFLIYSVTLGKKRRADTPQAGISH